MHKLEVCPACDDYRQCSCRWADKSGYCTLDNPTECKVMQQWREQELHKRIEPEA